MALAVERVVMPDSALQSRLRGAPGSSVLYLPGLDFANWYAGKIKNYSGQFLPPIDVGSAVIDGDTYMDAAQTMIDLTNPANLTGKLDIIKVWAKTNITGLRVGTFYLVSGTTYACRDSVTIGNVTAGSEKIFSVSLNVVEGDYLGCYFDTGELEANNTGGLGARYIAGEYIDAGDSADFASQEIDYKLSLYAINIVAEPNNGTITGATGVRLPSGVWALGFNLSDFGITQYVDHGGSASLVENIGPFTLSMWFYLLVFRDQDLVSTQYGKTDWTKPFDAFVAGGSDGRTTLWLGNNNESGGDIQLVERQVITQLGVPHSYIAKIDSSGNMMIWMDGVAGTPVDPFLGTRQTGTKLCLGNSGEVGGTRGLVGYLALVALSNSALSDAECASYHNKFKHLFNIAPLYPNMLILPSKLRLLLHGYPGSGATIYDQSPASQYDSSNGNNGAITGATWVHIKGGVYALAFAGGTDICNCGAGDSLANIWTQANGGSIEFWVKPTNNTTAGRIIDKQDAAGGRAGWYARLQNNASGSWKLGFLIESGTTDSGLWVTQNTVCPTNSWTHVMITYNHVDHTSTPVLCINGVAQVLVLDDPLVSDAYADDDAVELAIGNRASNTNVGLGGQVAEIKLYKNQTLSEAEALADYNNDVAFGIG